MFTAALFTTAKIWKQSKCPLIDEWVKIYVYNEILLGHKNEILLFATTQMDPEAILLSDISQRQIPYRI